MRLSSQSEGLHSKLHSVLFDKQYWTPKNSKEWLNSHDIKPIKPAHITAEKIRYRILNPKLFTKFVSKQLPNNITLVFGL